MSHLEPMSVEEILTAFSGAVPFTQEGDLPWSWRVRLWDAFNRTYGCTSMLRRLILGYVVARSTLPAFERVRDSVPPRMRDLPHRFLRDTKHVILGRVYAGTTTYH